VQRRKKDEQSYFCLQFGHQDEESWSAWYFIMMTHLGPAYKERRTYD
jgi:hypothetical protein